MYEGPQTVAAVFIETVTGTNGLIVPPDGYLQGLRELCDQHGILLVCDEVMCGLGRTGEWFAVDHWDVVPDIITMAKGLTSAYLPLGAVAISPGHRRPLPGPGLLRRADLQRPPHVPGRGGGHPQGAAGGRPGGQRQTHGRGDGRPAGRSRRTGTRRWATCAPSACSGLVELVRDRATKEPMAPFNGTSPEMQSLLALPQGAGAVRLRQRPHPLHEPAALHRRGRNCARRSPCSTRGWPSPTGWPVDDPPPLRPGDGGHRAALGLGEQPRLGAPPVGGTGRGSEDGAAAAAVLRGRPVADGQPGGRAHLVHEGVGRRAGPPAAVGQHVLHVGGVGLQRLAPSPGRARRSRPGARSSRFFTSP